jgi:hypothetical protein
MNSRTIRFDKRDSVDSILTASFTERLKKARAVNCSPLYLGIDSHLLRKLINIRQGSMCINR